MARGTHGSRDIVGSRHQTNATAATIIAASPAASPAPARILWRLVFHEVSSLPLAFEFPSFNGLTLSFPSKVSWASMDSTLSFRNSDAGSSVPSLAINGFLSTCRGAAIVYALATPRCRRVSKQLLHLKESCHPNLLIRTLRDSVPTLQDPCSYKGPCVLHSMRGTGAPLLHEQIG